MKLINSRVHGVIDYLFDFVLILAPSLFGLSPLASVICYTIAGVHFVMNLVTKYELSLVKLLPFPTHGTLELLAAVGFVVLPWLAGISEEAAARNFFIASGVALFLVWGATDYRSTSRATILDRTEDFTFRRVG